ncbi:VCBS repeat-containing protein [Sphingomonas kaistensis]|uniref:VCBS repeat-containing protein n=1 Tax=Sphingomonas kaistensis TaxID=298708 RepID=A0ABZ2G2F7_9SPHN
MFSRQAEDQYLALDQFSSRASLESIASEATTFRSPSTLSVMSQSTVGARAFSAATPVSTTYFELPDLVLNNFGVSQGWNGQRLFPRLLGDVNGDGFTDILGLSFNGLLVSYGTASGQFTQPAFIYGRTFFPRQNSYDEEYSLGFKLNDVNGDKRADLVEFLPGGVSVLLGQSDGTFGPATRTINDFGFKQGWTIPQYTPRLMADVNGDGRSDIVGFGYAGALVALATGETGQNQFKDPILGLADFGLNQGWRDADLFPRALGDVNGDGLADIVGFGDEGVSVSLSNGDGTFAPMFFALNDFGLAQGWSSQTFFKRLVGDVNGDNRADIVGFGTAGVYVALGRSDGTFSAPALDVVDFTSRQGWTNDNLYYRDLADLNNDGHLDIAGFGTAGVLAGLNTSSHFLV